MWNPFRRQTVATVAPVRPDTYTGRLVCDGEGNLLADEGPFAGQAVAHNGASYVWVDDGTCHNHRHHLGYVAIKATVQDEDRHHNGPPDDDPHYDPHAGVKRLVFTPDRDAAIETGHTEAYL